MGCCPFADESYSWDALHAQYEMKRINHEEAYSLSEGATVWKQFWLDLQDFLNLMHRHHVEPDGHFYLNGMGNMSDADSLLTALRNAKLFRAVMDDSEIATRA